MIEETKRTRRGRIRIAGIAAILSFAVLTLTSACVFSEKHEEEPESTTGWTWVSGSDSVGGAGVYGTKGTASSSNFPGARGYEQAQLDLSGKLWLFGGHGFDSADASGEINDLWKYNPSTLEWTWISGSNLVGAPGSYGVQRTASPTNVPGARDSYAFWMDLNGKLWVFGGFGYDVFGTRGILNDLWMFDPVSLEWTWVSGSETPGHAGIYGVKGVAAPANVPGSRYRSVSWIDSSGKFWLFGGFGADSAGADGDLNDLWQFDPATLEWTWVAGSELSDQVGIYGTKGTADPANVPGGRDASSSWRDSSGRFWLFGGEGYDAAGHLGLLSDLWMLDPASFEWTWVSGNNAVNQPGIYGTKGTASPSNIPGGNNGATGWLDPNGKFWLFGGNGYDASGNQGLLNDLWKYDPISSEWTWIAGGQSANQPGTYGTKGKRYLSNSPGGRYHTTSWISPNGELWLFGGDGLDADGNRNYLRDLWKYTR